MDRNFLNMLMAIKNNRFVFPQEMRKELVMQQRDEVSCMFMVILVVVVVRERDVRVCVYACDIVLLTKSSTTTIAPPFADQHDYQSYPQMDRDVGRCLT